MTARILIVDDVPSSARLLEARLGAEYYQVRTARDGLEALAVALGWQPDLVLLDVLMPGLDGYQTLRRLKADPATVHIPVVMITGLGEPGERLRGLEAGADDFLTKPVTYKTLLARVKSLIWLKRTLDEWRAHGRPARPLGLPPELQDVPSVIGARALVVDDAEPGARSVCDALAREGVLPGRAASATETMALTSAIPFDLIVLSLGMANDDPLYLASRLRAADATRATPLLLIAGPEHHELMLRGFDLGASDWIVRPVDENELRARARNQIRRKFYQDRLRSDLGQAQEMLLFDLLTGCYNQRYLMRRLRGLLETGTPGTGCVLLLDVDCFKTVNQHFGFGVGDNALRCISRTLHSHTRAFDCIARYGGGAFVVVMPDASVLDAQAAAELLRAAVEELAFIPVAGIRHPLTVSVGIAFIDRPDLTAEQILHAANGAMARAKRAGGNRAERAGADTHGAGACHRTEAADVTLALAS